MSIQPEDHTVTRPSSGTGGILFLFVVILSIYTPHAVFAGTVTNRWDLVIGGYVKFEMGMTDQGRQGFGANESFDDTYGNFTTTSTGTRLNFLVRGPDAWNARTSAFVEGDFLGVIAGSGRGTFALRHAFMSFEWPDAKLVVGQTFHKWGFLPTYTNAVLAGNDLSPFVKGHRQPMIRVERRIERDWNLSFAIMSPTNTLGSNRSVAATGTPDGFSLSRMPFYEASIGWSTDRWGKIGPWKTLFNIEGFYGQEKRLVTLLTDTPGTPGTAVSYGDKNVDSWGLAFKGFVPLIPEKQGNKEGSLSLSGVLFTARNPSWLQSRAYVVGSYARPGDTSSAPPQPASDPLPDFVAPRMYGVWGQLSYFITDSLFVNGWYGYLRNDTSGSFDAALSASTGRFLHANTEQNVTQYIVSLCYDLNQAVRFSAEYAYFVTRYANYGTVTTPDGFTFPNALSKDATYQAFRVGGWYFF